MNSEYQTPHPDPHNNRSTTADQVGRQMATESSVSNYFWSTFVDSTNVCDYRLPSVLSLTKFKKYN